MSVKIEKLDDNKIRVNGKLCYRNSDGQWVCPAHELTPNEQKSLYEFLTSCENADK